MTETLTQQRIASIINNSTVVFQVSANEKANGQEPWYSESNLGSLAVVTYSLLIEQKAQEYGVDPDLAKAVMYVENAQGYYFGLARIAEAIGVANSLFPMNIRPDIWQGLVPYGNFNDPDINIEAGVKLLKRITDRLNVEDRTIEKIATLYNSTGKTVVTDYGTRVAEVYHTKPWPEGYNSENRIFYNNYYNTPTMFKGLNKVLIREESWLN